MKRNRLLVEVAVQDVFMIGVERVLVSSARPGATIVHKDAHQLLLWASGLGEVFLTTPITAEGDTAQSLSCQTILKEIGFNLPVKHWISTQFFKAAYVKAGIFWKTAGIEKLVQSGFRVIYIDWPHSPDEMAQVTKARAGYIPVPEWNPGSEMFNTVKGIYAYFNSQAGIAAPPEPIPPPPLQPPTEEFGQPIETEEDLVKAMHGRRLVQAMPYSMGATPSVPSSTPGFRKIPQQDLEARAKAAVDAALGGTRSGIPRRFPGERPRGEGVVRLGARDEDD